MLLAEALLAEHRVYRSDALAVGIDVYNVEAEACGAVVEPGSPEACPEIPRPPWSFDALAKELEPPAIRSAGRFPLVLEAAARLRDRLARTREAPVIRVPVSGPVTTAAKLVGTEPLLIGLAMGEPDAERILEFCTTLALEWCRGIRSEGFDAMVFDSTASPPMLSPALYAEAVQPLHERIMAALRESGQGCRPLVIGGDASSIARSQAETGATMLVCDYRADAAAFASGLREAAAAPAPTAGEPLSVRRNVDPARLSRGEGAEEPGGDRDGARLVAEELICDLMLFDRPVAGTGILPYRQDPRMVVRLRDLLFGDDPRLQGLPE